MNRPRLVVSRGCTCYAHGHTTLAKRKPTGNEGSVLLTTEPFPTSRPACRSPMAARLADTQLHSTGNTNTHSEAGNSMRHFLQFSVAEWQPMRRQVIGRSQEVGGGGQGVERRQMRMVCFGAEGGSQHRCEKRR